MVFYLSPTRTPSNLILQTGAEMDKLTSGSVEADRGIHTSLAIAQLSNAFPFGIEGSPERAMDFLLKHLPAQYRAWSLCETYMEHASWIIRLMERDEIIDEILIPIYKEKDDTDSEAPRSISYHKLAVLFLVFAIGARVDLTLEPCKRSFLPHTFNSFMFSDNTESKTFYHLGRACLSMCSVFDSPEIATVQAVVLMGFYDALCETPTLDRPVSY